MGLNSEVTATVQEAFDGDLADAVNAVSLVYTSSAYDTSTGTVTPTTTKVSTRGVISPVDNSLVDGEVVLMADVSILILQTELAATPKINDHIEQSTRKYQIYNITADPAAVQWTMLAREI